MRPRHVYDLIWWKECCNLVDHHQKDLRTKLGWRESGTAADLLLAGICMIWSIYIRYIFISTWSDRAHSLSFWETFHWSSVSQSFEILFRVEDFMDKKSSEDGQIYLEYWIQGTFWSIKSLARNILNYFSTFRLALNYSNRPVCLPRNKSILM